MFGKKASELVREVKKCSADQFRPFNKDLFEHVMVETDEHFAHLQERMRQMQLSNSASVDGDFLGGLVHHQSIMRNKRCMLAYLNKRAERIQQLRWELGAALPKEINDSLCQSEKEYFRGYSDLLGSYMSKINLDLTMDATPPKDLYIQVRVTDDIGEVLLDDQATTLLRHSIHFMKRTQAESLIYQGLMEEFMG